MEIESSRADRPGVETRRLEALTSIAATIARSPDLDTVLAAALDATLAALGLAIGGVYLLDDETGDLRATSHFRGVPAEYAANMAPITAVTSLACRGRISAAPRQRLGGLRSARPSVGES